MRHERFNLRTYFPWSDHGPTLPRCKSCRGKFLYSIKYIHCISLRMFYPGDQIEYLRLIGTLEIRAIHQEIGLLKHEVCLVWWTRVSFLCHADKVGALLCSIIPRWGIIKGTMEVFSLVLCYLLGCNWGVLLLWTSANTLNCDTEIYCWCVK